MDQRADNIIPFAGAVQDVPAPDRVQPPPPVRTVFKPLFFLALLLAAALAGLCGRLYLERRDALEQLDELELRTTQIALEREEQRTLSEELYTDFLAQSQAMDELRTQLELAQTAAAQAQDTIELLSAYSLAAPDGTVPEYTQLYPDFYVPDWTGETVTGGRVCCLTFDDGPSSNTDRVLEILDRYGIKATFFVVGTSASTPANQERMRQIVEAGHTIAMHSWSHDYKKVYASVEAFLDEFYRLYQYIYEVTGVYPSVFRFPGGSINGYDRGMYQEIIAEMTRRGFVYFDWNASAQDATATPRAASAIAADCLKGVGRELAVVLAHDSGARGTTVDALPSVIEGYQQAGYTFSALHPGVEQVTFGYPKMR